jgi:hypothetical protein
MARLSLLLFLFAFAICSKGQNSATQLPKFEVGENFFFGINAGIHRPVNLNFENVNLMTGVVAEAHAEYRPTKSLGLITRPNYTFTQYERDAENERITQHTFGVLLGGKMRPTNLESSSFIIGVNPAFIGFGRISDIRRSSISGESQNLTPNLDQRFLVAGYVGFELKLNEYTALELGYQLNSISQDENSSLIQNQPHLLQFKLNWDIASRWKEENNQNELATLDSLRNDTLYIINTLCDEDPTEQQLDSLLKEHYTYSAYKILDKNDSQSNEDAWHYAVIGRYYASEGDPQTNGIYLLDSNLKHTQSPYPFYTSNRSIEENFFNNCFITTTALADVIKRFNSRLLLRD